MNDLLPLLSHAGDVNYDIAAHISPATSLVVLTDAQGNQAVVTSGGKKFGNIMLYDISAVLMSGASISHWLSKIQI
jgi:hypothetical protein